MWFSYHLDVKDDIFDSALLALSYNGDSLYYRVFIILITSFPSTDEPNRVNIIDPVLDIPTSDPYLYAEDDVVRLVPMGRYNAELI